MYKNIKLSFDFSTKDTKVRKYFKTIFYKISSSHSKKNHPQSDKIFKSHIKWSKTEAQISE